MKKTLSCVAVSDFHMRDVITPNADLLLVGGDMTFKGENHELNWFRDWLLRQPQKQKIWIAGNHELGLEYMPERAASIAEETKSIYLNDSMTEIGGLKIWGSPVTPWFYDWAFNRRRGEEIREHWKLIPEGLDILITHGPPYGFGDKTHQGQNVGCEELLEVLLQTLVHPPRFHIFGHIHSGYGRTVMKRDDGKAIECINASICNEQYQMAHAPIQFDVSLKS
jgi:Icc-related predicted phosphoesterase